MRCGLRLEFVAFPHRMLLFLPEVEVETPGGMRTSEAGRAAELGAESSPRQSDEASLCGLSVANFASHGPEVVEVLHTNTLNEISGLGGAGGGGGGGCGGGKGSGGGGGVGLEAIKLTGDPFVPAGQVTWRTEVAPASTAHHQRLRARLQVADLGFANARMLLAEVEVCPAAPVVGSDGAPRHEDVSLLVHHENSSTLFSRCDDSAQWYIDPCAAGKLLPPATCREVLRHAGLPPSQHDRWLAPVPTPHVLARVCRNLALYFLRERRATEATLWEDAATGLDPADK